MGIRGVVSLLKESLTSYCSHSDLHLWKKDSCSEYCNIIVDGNAFAYWICLEVLSANRAFSNYQTLSKYVATWYSRCIEAKVNCVFVFDGPTEIGKLVCKLGRFREHSISLQHFTHNVITNGCGARMFIPPMMSIRCISETIVKQGGKVYYSTGEADKLLVQLANSFSAIGIFTNDSDILAFADAHDIGIIPFWAVGFGDDGKMYGHVLQQSKMCAIHGISSNDLPLLAALLGNDATDPELVLILQNRLWEWKNKTGNFKQLLQNQRQHASHSRSKKQKSKKSSKKAQKVVRGLTNLECEEHAGKATCVSTSSQELTLCDEKSPHTIVNNVLADFSRKVVKHSNKSSSTQHSSLNTIKVALEFLSMLKEKNEGTENDSSVSLLSMLFCTPPDEVNLLMQDSSTTMGNKTQQSITACGEMIDQCLVMYGEAREMLKYYEFPRRNTIMNGHAEANLTLDIISKLSPELQLVANLRLFLLPVTCYSPENETSDYFLSSIWSRCEELRNRFFASIIISCTSIPNHCNDSTVEVKEIFSCNEEGKLHVRDVVLERTASLMLNQSFQYHLLNLLSLSVEKADGIFETCNSNSSPSSSSSSSSAMIHLKLFSLFTWNCSTQKTQEMAFGLVAFLASYLSDKIDSISSSSSLKAQAQAQAQDGNSSSLTRNISNLWSTFEWIFQHYLWSCEVASVVATDQSNPLSVSLNVCCLNSSTFLTCFNHLRSLPQRHLIAASSNSLDQSDTRILLRASKELEPLISQDVFVNIANIIQFI